MLKAMGILSTSEPVKGIIVNRHGVEIGPDIPVLDSHRVANGVLGHLERAWIEDDSSLWGELIFTGRAGRRVYELIERGPLSGVSCRLRPCALRFAMSTATRLMSRKLSNGVRTILIWSASRNARS